MALARVLLGTIGIATLAGCATRPQLADAGYGQYASIFSGIHHCVVNDQMTNETAGIGLRFTAANLATWSYDKERLDGYISRFNQMAAPPASWCTAQTAYFLEKQRRIVAQNQADAQASVDWNTALAPLQRNYLTNPVTLAPATKSAQPNVGGDQAGEWQTVYVNTPSGLVAKRCKVLNGQNVACF